MAHLELAQRDGGFVVRVVADNGLTVLSSGPQLYADQAAAERAIEITAEALNTQVSFADVRYVDERSEG